MLVKNYGLVKPYPIYAYLSLLLALIVTGLCVALYLSVAHYRIYTDMGYSSFCAISKAINCDTVSQSPYSIFLGIPVPIWGVVGYVFILVALIFSVDTKSQKLNMLPVLTIIGIIFSLISLGLGIISAINIQSYCMMCIITYGVNFLFLFMIWMIRRRFETTTWKRSLYENIEFLKVNKARAVKFFLPLLVCILLIKLFIPDYWHFSLSNPGNITLKTGITEQGSPWIGAKKPQLTIIEYSDYMCFQCKKMHFFLRNLVALYPDKIRLIHKHFPMDKKSNPMLTEDLNPGSGILSSVAIHAVQENKFWEVNDRLYQYNMDRGAIFLNEIANSTGLDLKSLKTGIHKPIVKQRLQKDIISGLKLNIIGTPTYIINNRVYPGQIPPAILDSIKE